MSRLQLRAVLREEWNGANPRLFLALAICRALPDLVGNRLRTTALRFAGLHIGHGTVIGGEIRIAGGRRCADRITIGERGWINAGAYLDASDQIDIGDDVAIGQHVLVLTQTHELGVASRRAGPRIVAPVRIGGGCWIGARSTILPGVTVGAGAIVAAGSVVVSDVGRDTLVGGVPAKPIRSLD